MYESYIYIYTESFHLSFYPILINNFETNSLCYNLATRFVIIDLHYLLLPLIYTPYFITTLSFHLLGKLLIYTTYVTTVSFCLSHHGCLIHLV